MVRNSSWTVVPLLLFGSFCLSVMAEHVPPQAVRSVAFVYVPDGHGQLQAHGTCFFVGMRHPSIPDSGWVYVVTARHVLQRDMYDPTSDLVPQIVIRVNNAKGSAEFLKVLLKASGVDKNVYLHPDRSVDLAVLEVPQADPTKLDVSLVGVEMFLSAADVNDHKLNEGIDLFFAGMFTSYLGVSRIQPIVRFGRLAMIPSEPVEWLGLPTELLLADTFSFGGNSGSPVFFYEGIDRDAGSITIGEPLVRLAGVMEGYFPDAEPTQTLDVPASARRRGRSRKVIYSFTNTGIAAITPAYKLHEILFGRELSSKRNPQSGRP